MGLPWSLSGLLGALDSWIMAPECLLSEDKGAFSFISCACAEFEVNLMRVDSTMYSQK